MLIVRATRDCGNSVLRKCEDYGLGFLLLVFEVYSTHAYHAPPRSVTEMPTAFVVVMVRLKSETANRIVKTCLTLAMDRG